MIQMNLCSVSFAFPKFCVKLLWSWPHSAIFKLLWSWSESVNVEFLWSWSLSVSDKNCLHFTFSWFRIKICFHIQNSYNVRNFSNKCVIDSLSNSPHNLRFLQLSNLFPLNVPILRQRSSMPLLAGGLFTHSLTRQEQIAMSKVFIKKCHEEKGQR